MRKKQLWIWTAAVLVVAGCGSKKTSQSDEVASELGAPPSTATAVRRPYVLGDAGIRFDPPAGWDLARIDVVPRSGDDAEAGRAGARFSVEFAYKAEQPAHRNEPLFSIYVVPKSRWSGAGDDSLGALIDSTDDWVYLAATARGNPYREGLLDADQFEAMRITLDEIRAGFTIEHGGPADPTLRAESPGK